MEASSITESSANRLCTLSVKSFNEAYHQMEDFGDYLEKRVSKVFNKIEFRKMDMLKDHWHKEGIYFDEETLLVFFHSWITDYDGTESKEEIVEPAYIETTKPYKDHEKINIIRAWKEEKRGIMVYFFIEMELLLFLELENSFNFTPDRETEAVLSQSRTKESFRDALYQVMSDLLAKELRIRTGFSDEKPNDNFLFTACATIYDEEDLNPHNNNDIFGRLKIGLTSDEEQHSFLTFNLKNNEWVTLEGKISVEAFLQIIYDAAANRNFRPSKSSMLRSS